MLSWHKIRLSILQEYTQKCLSPLINWVIFLECDGMKLVQHNVYFNSTVDTDARILAPKCLQLWAKTRVVTEDKLAKNN